MAKLKVKKGDNVVVISGKDRGKTGKITQIIPAKNRAVVEGINIIIKHQKPKGNNQKGGIIRKSAPMQISNLMVVCPVCGKATRVGKKEVSGKLSRFCKKCGAILDKEYVKSVKKEQKKKDVSSEETVEKVKSKKEETSKIAPKTETTKKVSSKKQKIDSTEKEQNLENQALKSKEDKEKINTKVEKKTDAKVEKKAEIKTDKEDDTKTEKAKTEKAKIEKNLQKEKIVKTVTKPKIRNTASEQVKKAINKNVARTTKIHKSTNRGK